MFSFSFGLLFVIDSVSSGFVCVRRAKQTKTDVRSKIRIFDREERSLRSTAGPYCRFASRSSRTPVFVSVEDTKQAELIRSVQMVSSYRSYAFVLSFVRVLRLGSSFGAIRLRCFGLWISV